MIYNTLTLPPRAHDIAGHVYGRLTAIAPVDRDKYNGILWLCICSCGTEMLIRVSALNCGNSSSCGCLYDDTRGHNKTHNMSKTSEYSVWSQMKGRCQNPNDSRYESYGGRGITVCQRWLQSFDAFHDDMGKHPKGTTLDRFDNDKGYSPKNCRWATPRQQQNNMRSNVILTFNGQSLTVAQWSRRIGMRYVTLRYRIIRGWSVERALTEPVNAQFAAYRLRADLCLPEVAPGVRSLMKKYGRKDGNQDDLVGALEKAGCSVQSLANLGSGCPDLLCGRAGKNYLLEVKNEHMPPSKRKLTPDQFIWTVAWNGQVDVVKDIDEALSAVGL